VLLAEFPLQVSQKWGMPFCLEKSGGTTFPLNLSADDDDDDAVYKPITFGFLAST